MKLISLLLSATAILFLSSCGNDTELHKKISDIETQLKEIKTNPQLSQAIADINKIKVEMTISKEALINAQNILQSSIEKSLNAAQSVDSKVASSLASFNLNLNSMRKESEKLTAQFKSFDEKIARLENLYANEGLIELTGDDGKINVESFPALAETEAEFIEEVKGDQQKPLDFLNLSGRVQSNGKWTINGKSYKLFDFMTFDISKSDAKFKDGVDSFYLTGVTFKNTHGEIVTTKEIRGYLLNENNEQRLKWQTRVLESGKNQAFIEKGTKCKVVLSRPLNFGIRK